MRLLSAALCGVLLLATAPASAVVLTATARGLYDSAGTMPFGPAANANVTIGDNLSSEFRGYFNFDLSAVSGTVSAATFHLDGTAFVFANPSETFGFFDFTGNVANLLAGTGGVAAFGDLGSGASYGTAVQPAGSGSVAVSLAVTLNAAALADINAALGGDFALGAALTSLNDPLFEFFAFSPSLITQLELEVTAAPEPASLALFGTGLLAGGWLRRRWIQARL